MEVRIGTAEREAAVAALGAELAAGRLAAHEFEERAATASRARTRAELEPLFADLPPPSFLVLGPEDPGRLPAGLLAGLAGEGLRVLDQDVPGTLVYRSRRRHRPHPVRGSVAVSGRRLVVWADGAKRVDLPHGHPLRPAVDVSATRAGLRVTVELGAFDPRRSGEMEVVLRTDRAAAVTAALRG